MTNNGKPNQEEKQEMQPELQEMDEAQLAAVCGGALRLYNDERLTGSGHVAGLAGGHVGLGIGVGETEFKMNLG